MESRFNRDSSLIKSRAAFHPSDSSHPHPLLPDGVDGLTMFADYRVSSQMATNLLFC